MLNYLKMVFWFLALALLIWAVRSVDITEVTALIVKMQWGLLIVLSVYILINFVDAAAWKCTLQRNEAHSVTLWGMWQIRQIGEAFNMGTPFGTMGGEPLKAQLLKETFGLNMKQAVSSLVVSRTTNLLGLTLFLLIGAVFILLAPNIDQTFKTTSLIGLIVFSILILMFLFFQIHGALKTIANWFAKLSFSESIQSELEHIAILSHHMADYYQKNPIRSLENQG